MSKAVETVIDILAVYRLTRMVNRDYIFEDVRQKIFERFPPNTKIGYLFTCDWCMSIWCAVFLIAIKRLRPDEYKVLASILAASGVTGIISDRI